VLNEGDSVALDGSSSYDPDPDTLIYRWDLDNDANYGELGEPTGVAPVVSWATLQSFGIDDDGAPYTIGLEVDDGTGNIDTTTASLTVNNTAPTISAAGNATVAASNSYTLNLSATDPGNDTVSGWTINWGDGAIDTIVGNPLTASHTYTEPGLTYGISAAVTDEDGTHFDNDLIVPTAFFTGE
jgi:hypothetical protein